MKIIKHFSDYYDNALSYVDTSMMYNRESKVVEMDITNYPDLQIPSSNWTTVVFFCGKSYVFDSGAHITCLQDAIEARKNSKRVGCGAAMQRFIDVYANGKSHSSLLLDLNVPVASCTRTYTNYCKLGPIRKAEVIINPCLKDLGFYKAVDPYTACQEIQMFISGVLGNNGKDIIDISDTSKIAKHGFDKMSFRKKKTLLNN